MKTGTIDNAVHRYFISYIDLNPYIETGFRNIESENCDIYIDLDSIFRTIIDTMRGYDYKIGHPMELTVKILDMIAHYKHYMSMKFYNVKLRVFLIGGYSGIYYTPLQYNEIYNINHINALTALQMQNSLVLDYISNTFKSLELIVPYLENIYMFNTPEESPAIIKYIIDKTNSTNNAKLVISRNKLCCLLQNS